MKKIVVQGLGYVGAATAIALASIQNRYKQPAFNVIGLDLNSTDGLRKINKINAGFFPYKSNDNSISQCLKKISKTDNLTASYDLKNYKNTSVVIMSVNFDLSVDKKNFNLELGKLKKNFLNIIENISENTLILIETTLPPGTTEKILYPILLKIANKRRLNHKKIYLAHSYERVTPGKNYINSILNYWRVYGGINKESSKKCKIFLSKFINLKKFPLTQLENTTCSEISKILENTFRATNIALIDEWSEFAEKINIDLYKIIEAIRVRPTHANIRYPGFGVGGYCLTKDPLFGQISANNIFNYNNLDFNISKRSVSINKKLPFRSINKILNLCNGKIKNKKILLFGATYKEDIGDTRNSASEMFYKILTKKGAIIKVHDPLINYWEEVNTKTLKSVPNLNVFDILFFAVRNKDYRKINFKRKNLKKNTIIFDANNVLSYKQISSIKKQNIKFYSIGRGKL